MKNNPKPNVTPISALTTKPLSQAELGLALMNEAQARQNQAKMDKAVSFAETILSTIEECDRQIAYFTGWKKTRERQMAALESGAFSFDNLGAITFQDEELNRK
jgi:hypothetical protein